MLHGSVHLQCMPIIIPDGDCCKVWGGWMFIDTVLILLAVVCPLVVDTHSLTFNNEELLVLSSWDLVMDILTSSLP